ncbi:hypothetical protein LINPERHAP1_LOCUS14287 [Linum perenne]
MRASFSPGVHSGMDGEKRHMPRL